MFLKTFETIRISGLSTPELEIFWQIEYEIKSLVFEGMCLLERSVSLGIIIPNGVISVK